MNLLEHLLKKFTKDNIDYFFSCDNYTDYIFRLLTVLSFWAILWGSAGEDAEPPNGYLFQILLIYVLCRLSGELMSLFNFPAVVGILIVGFILGNILTITISYEILLILRQIPQTVVLLRAGLNIDHEKILQLSAVCLRLSYVPSIVETLTIAISAHYFLGVLDLEWGLLMGFILAAVSPAVVVAAVLPLKDKGYGVDKGIPTLLMVSSSVFTYPYNILGIGGITRLVFDTQPVLVWILLIGPLETLMGVMFGITFGLILWYIPSNIDEPRNERKRFWLLILSAISVRLCLNQIQVRSAGPLTALIISYVAAIEWRRKEEHKKIKTRMLFLWTMFCQPILFGLIGAQVQISYLKNQYLFKAILCLLIGLVMRCLTAFIVVFGANFNLKEKIFIAIAWLPKTTTQATYGPIVLSIAYKSHTSETYYEDLDNAQLVLTLAVLSILLTVPIGSIAIAYSGPKLLHKTKTSEPIVPNIPSIVETN